MLEMLPLPLSSHAKPVDSFAQAADLEQELRRAVSGEVRFDRGSRALYATDGSNYRQMPIGLVVPRDADDVIAAVAACRKYGAPVLPRGAGTSLAGQCCNVAVVLDFTKYMNRILEIDPRQALRAACSRASCCDTLRNRRRGAPADVRARSLHAQPLHARRHDRQQLLRHALAARRQDGRQRRGAADPALRRHAAHGRRRPATSELAAIIAAGRPPRRDLRRDSRAIRDRYAPLDPGSGSRTFPRRVSGYNLDELLPENGFNVARALVGTEGTCAIVLEAKVTADPQPAAPLAGRSRIRGRVRGRRSRARDPRVPADRPRRVRRRHDRRRCSKKGAPNLELIPEGRGVLLVEFGADDAPTADATAQRSHRAAAAGCRARRRPGCIRRTKPGPSGRSASPARAPPLRRRARRRGGKGGTMRRSRRRSWAPICATCARCSTNTTTRRRSTGTSATAASTCRSASICGASRASGSTASSSIGPPTSWSATADRSRASMATASRAARCCRRCSAPS